MHPPFSFWRPKKRTGRARSKRKNARDEMASVEVRQVSARGVGCAGVWRFRILPASFSAGAPVQRQRGLRDRPFFNHQRQLPEFARGGSRFKGRERRAPVGDWRIGGSSLEQLPYLSELARLRKFRAKRFFSWTAPPPVLFLPLQMGPPQERKRSGSCGERRSKGAGTIFAARRKWSQADFATTTMGGGIPRQLPVDLLPPKWV